jgi:glycosyltransferase involved in cell wall biosynthesis
MSKILLLDPYNGKFTTDMQNHWLASGHEVQRHTYYHPQLANEWADVIYFFTCDNNLLSATNPGSALLADDSNYHPWALHQMDLTNKRIIVHPVDIEVWQGHHAYDNMWNIVDDVIFPAPHIQDIFNADSRTQGHKFKQHVIPFGVNLDRWTFKERQKGFNIGVVSELWETKGVDLALQIAMKLKEIDPRYQIHWRGPNQMYHWGKAYFDDLAKDLPITHEVDFVEDLNEWWEDKNYVLHCGQKETYTYAVAEAMSKGIKPVFHRYFGAEATWPGLTWTSIDEAVNLITEDKYDSSSYRQYLIDHQLTLPQMMAEIDKIIGE